MSPYPQSHEQEDARPLRWRSPETAAGQLRADLAFALVSAATLFMLRPLLHKSSSYTMSYVLTWFVLSSTVALTRFARRRRQRR
jgi:hypothetical protein